MSTALKNIVVIVLSISHVRSHVAYINQPDNLQPVHGLYIKPSTDGTTGDLYVAATEENGVSAQWLTEQPVNFLQFAASAQQQPATVPASFTSTLTTTALPNDETIVTSQKRAVISTPTYQYAYVPVQGSTYDAGALTPYPYAALAAAAATQTASEGTTAKCAETSPTPTTIAQYNPFQFYYPQMMNSAFTNAMNILKEAGLSDEVANSISSQATPLWSSAAYAYPVQYVMVDPKSWQQVQTPTMPAPTVPTETTKENDLSNATL